MKRVSVPYWGFFLLNATIKAGKDAAGISFRPLLGLFFIESEKYVNEGATICFRPLLGLFFIELCMKM